MFTGVDCTSSIAKGGVVSLALATVTMSPIIDSRFDTPEFLHRFYKNKQYDVSKKISGYSTNSIELDNEYTACKIDDFFWVNKNFVIDTKDVSYIKNYSFVFESLLNLRLIISREFENVSVSLKPFYGGGSPGLIVEIPLSDDVEKDFSKFNRICKKWFGETDLEINSDIYIDLV